MIERSLLKKKLIQEETARLVLEIEVLELYADMIYKKKLSDLNKKERVVVCETLLIQSLAGVKNG